MSGYKPVGAALGQWPGPEDGDRAGKDLAELRWKVAEAACREQLEVSTDVSGWGDGLPGGVRAGDRRGGRFALVMQDSTGSERTLNIGGWGA